MKPYMPFLKTLRRIPDHIVLDMATRDVTMGDPNSCVCGTALRLSLVNGSAFEETRAFRRNTNVSNIGPVITRHLAETWGGSIMEWKAVYMGVVGWTALDESDVSLPPLIEEAFTRRVMECV